MGLFSDLSRALDGALFGWERISYRMFYVRDPTAFLRKYPAAMDGEDVVAFLRRERAPAAAVAEFERQRNNHYAAAEADQTVMYVIERTPLS